MQVMIWWCLYRAYILWFLLPVHIMTPYLHSYPPSQPPSSPFSFLPSHLPIFPHTLPPTHPPLYLPLTPPPLPPPTLPPPVNYSITLPLLPFLPSFLLLPSHSPSPSSLQMRTDRGDPIRDRTANRFRRAPAIRQSPIRYHTRLTGKCLPCS